MDCRTVLQCLTIKLIGRIACGSFQQFDDDRPKKTRLAEACIHGVRTCDGLRQDNKPATNRKMIPHVNCRPNVSPKPIRYAPAVTNA
jgi:hypothetical protein